MWFMIVLISTSNLNKSYTEIVYKILYLSFYSKITRSRTKGEISNTGKGQQRNFKSKIFCVHIFRGEGHFPGLKAKWRERSEAQGCPYKRYGKSVHKKFELIQERNTWYCERAEPKISHCPSVSLNHFFSLFPHPSAIPSFQTEAQETSKFR